jgi:hypothetical protein
MKIRKAGTALVSEPVGRVSLYMPHETSAQLKGGYVPEMRMEYMCDVTRLAGSLTD